MITARAQHLTISRSTMPCGRGRVVLPAPVPGIEAKTLKSLLRTTVQIHTGGRQMAFPPGTQRKNSIGDVLADLSGSSQPTHLRRLLVWDQGRVCARCYDGCRKRSNAFTITPQAVGMATPFT